MNASRISRLPGITCLSLLSIATGQEAIDFETLPDGTPTFEGQLSYNQYETVLGIRFSIVDRDSGQPPGNRNTSPTRYLAASRAPLVSQSDQAGWIRERGVSASTWSI
jgi:hypothetical protein